MTFEISSLNSSDEIDDFSIPFSDEEISAAVEKIKNLLEENVLIMFAFFVVVAPLTERSVEELTGEQLNMLKGPEKMDGKLLLASNVDSVRASVFY